MSDIEQRLRDALMAEAELLSYPLDRPLPTAPELRPRPGWLIAGATAAAVLLLVAGGVWMVGLVGETNTELGSDVTLSAAPIEVGTFVQLAGDDEFGVEPLSEEPDENGDVVATATITAAVAGPKGMVAVGSLDGSGGGIGAIWYSPDGSKWQRIPHDDDLFGIPTQPANTVIVDVAAGDSGFLGVGFHFAEPREQIVWSSSDGLIWSRTEVPGLVGTAVVAAESGWTLVGGGGLQGAVWNSSDGLDWEAASGEAFTSDTHDIGIRDVAYDGQRFVAVGGSSAREFRQERPMIWISDDGSHWEAIEDESGVFDIPTADGIGSVVAGPSGFVAVGEERIADGDDPANGVAWVSADGLEWRRVRLGEAYSGRPLTITASEAGYVVLGFYSADDVTYGSRLWTSTDGVAWEVVDPEGLEDHFPGTSLQADRRLLLFGSLRRDTGETYDNAGLGGGAVWEANL